MEMIFYKCNLLYVSDKERACLSTFLKKRFATRPLFFIVKHKVSGTRKQSLIASAGGVLIAEHKVPGTRKQSLIALAGGVLIHHQAA